MSTVIDGRNDERKHVIVARRKGLLYQMQKYNKQWQQQQGYKQKNLLCLLQHPKVYAKLSVQCICLGCKMTLGICEIMKHILDIHKAKNAQKCGSFCAISLSQILQIPSSVHVMCLDLQWGHAIKQKPVLCNFCLH